MKPAARSHLFLLLSALFFCLTPALGLGETRIGVIMSGDIPYYAAMHEAFVKELRARIPAGENLEIILQRPFPDAIAWSNAARKLIAVDVDLIVTYGSPATLAVVQEKSAIPLVYAGVYDPENAGIKGAKLTGSGYRVPLSSLLRYFKRLKTLDSLTVIFSSIEEDSVRQKEEMIALAAEQAIKTRLVDLKTKADLEKLRALAMDDTVFLTGSALAHVWLKDILALLRGKKSAVGSMFPDMEEPGVLLALFLPPEEQGKAAAAMAVKILAGGQPGSHDPEIFRETQLVFNQVEAQHIGITFPIQLIVEATRVIK